MTSAPKSPSTVAASGPAKSVAASMILIPSSACLPSKPRPPAPQQYALIFAHAPCHRKVLTGPRAPCYVGDALCVLGEGVAMGRFDTVVLGGRAVLPGQGLVRTDVGIKDGRISVLGEGLSSGDADEVVDA